MAEDAPQRIVIFKKKKTHNVAHGGSWKVALADFMTTMFALFLVLWILTQSQDVKTAVASYFRHPSDYEGHASAIFRGNNGLMENRQGRMDLMSNMLETSGAKREGSEGLSVKTPQSVAGGLSASSPEPGLRPDIVERIEEQERDEVRTFLRLADDLWSKLGLDPEFQHFKDNVAIEAHEEGLLIQLIEQPRQPLFEPGTAELQSRIKRICALLAPELAHYPNKLEIDGHGVAIAQVYASNQKWLASTYMADQLRTELERHGVKPQQISKISGCADTRPLNAHSPDDPLNRRISILVRPRQWRPEHY